MVKKILSPFIFVWPNFVKLIFLWGIGLPLNYICLFLYLHDCWMYGEFPVGIFKLPNIRVLDMKFNKDLSVSWPDFQSWSSPLEEISLAGINFSSELPATMGNLGSQIVLDVSSCNLSGPFHLQLVISQISFSFSFQLEISSTLHF